MKYLSIKTMRTSTTKKIVLGLLVAFSLLFLSSTASVTSSNLSGQVSASTTAHAVANDTISIPASIDKKSPVNRHFQASKAKKLPLTGDTTNIVLLILGCCLIAGTLFTTFFRKNK